MAADYETIIDEECKVRTKTPQASKFREYPLEMTDGQRKRLFVARMEGRPRTRANLMEAFFRASNEAWKDYRRSGRERAFVGYSPIIVIDADKIVRDLPHAHVLHVVRNPWSAYADTKKRAVPLSLAHYITGWCLNQQAALTFQSQLPGHVHLLRFEDIVADPQTVLGHFLTRVGFSGGPTLATPSWNGRPMPEVYPWGTIRQPTPAANRATATELCHEETEEIRLRAATSRTGSVTRTSCHRSGRPPEERPRTWRRRNLPETSRTCGPCAPPCGAGSSSSRTLRTSAISDRPWASWRSSPRCGAACCANAGTHSSQRDRFVLSKGHAVLALYCALHCNGLLSEQQFASYCGDGSLLGGHPEHALPGIDVSTGSLGQGLSIGCGLAYGLRLQQQSWSRVRVGQRCRVQ